MDRRVLTLAPESYKSQARPASWWRNMDTHVLSQTRQLLEEHGPEDTHVLSQIRQLLEEHAAEPTVALPLPAKEGTKRAA